jgi:hypothetical protein
MQLHRVAHMKLLLTQVAMLVAIAGCTLGRRPQATGLEACPAPDSAGMSQRLADRFYRMSQDTLGRSSLEHEHIQPALITVPQLATDAALCDRLAAKFGVPVPGKPEGGTFYVSGPYVVYSPWRDYRRRAEWSNKSEFVGLIIMDRDLRVLAAFGM